MAEQQELLVDMGMRVGVDIGGTFIDFCLWDETREELHSLKVLTTPRTPGAELLRGLDLLQERHGISPSDITSFVHGTTVGINTVIQRKGASLALLTTENFEDVVELARLRMPEAYSLFSRRGAPLVPRDRIFGIRERMRAELGKRACVSMVLSGTASGVMGAAWVAKEAGHPNVITLDIGGTSADVALIIDGQPQFGLGEKIGDLPLYIPSVAVSSIGDGGGSIAWVDGFGVLKVGPESAGSAPGPACYGRGGTQPTITDAFAVCGFLGQHDLAYGAFRPR